MQTSLFPAVCCFLVFPLLYMLSFFLYFFLGLIKLFSFCSSLLSLYATWSFYPPSSPLSSSPFPFARLSLTLLTVMTKKCQRPRRRIITSMDRHSTCPVAEGVVGEEVQQKEGQEEEGGRGREGGVAWRCRGHLQVAGFQRHFPSFLRLLRFIFPLLVHVLFSLLLLLLLILLLLSCFLLCFFVMSCVFPLFFVGGSDNELMFLIDEEIWVAIRTDCG